MKKIAIGPSFAALVLAGAAHAAPTPPPAPPSQANQNRVITRAEAQAAATSIFTQMDANKDGTFDRTDRDTRRKAMEARLFDRLDTNKDGQISRAEFTASQGPRGGDAERGGPGRAGRAGKGPASAMTQQQFVAAALQRFDASDTNKDGQVTAEERRTARQQRQTQRQQAQAPKPKG